VDLSALERSGPVRDHPLMSTTTAVQALYTMRAGQVRTVDVPELGFVVVDGTGDPDGPVFAEALQALYGVSYAAHFLARERGTATKVMPLEALWWVDDPDQQDLVHAVALGRGAMTDTDRSRWCWQAMIMQPEPIDVGIVAEAVQRTRRKRPSASLDRLRYERWQEGLAVQLLHVGPYADEAPSIVRLHEAIPAAGYRARGRHHEIYVGDPRRSAPEKLRTILRQPVEPA
jgi:hypothetical protein